MSDTLKRESKRSAHTKSTGIWSCVLEQLGRAEGLLERKNNREKNVAEQSDIKMEAKHLIV